MALIENAKGRPDGGGYQRLFGNRALGHLISRVQGAVISAGAELERIIAAKVDAMPNLDEFLRRGGDMDEGVLIATKRQVKNSRVLAAGASEPDFLIFKNRDSVKRCHVIELKDGDAFDTKKAHGEWVGMQQFVNDTAPQIPFVVEAHFCCFNQRDQSLAVQAFKGKIPAANVLTGPQFCSLLEIDYREIVDSRRADADRNLNYFIGELAAIPEVSDRFRDIAPTP